MVFRNPAATSEEMGAQMQYRPLLHSLIIVAVLLLCLGVSTLVLADGLPADPPAPGGKSDSKISSLSPSASGAAISIALVDYDTDDDNLIEIATLTQLNAIRWDVNGDGHPKATRATMTPRSPTRWAVRPPAPATS